MTGAVGAVLAQAEVKGWGMLQVKEAEGELNQKLDHLQQDRDLRHQRERDQCD